MANTTAWCAAPAPANGNIRTQALVLKERPSTIAKAALTHSHHSRNGPNKLCAGPEWNSHNAELPIEKVEPNWNELSMKF